MASPFESCFLFLRNPAGGVENISDMKAAGFGGVFCNVGDFGPEQWDVIRSRCRDNGMFCGPWARTAKKDANGNQLHPAQWDPLVLERLVTIADRWSSPLVVNSEKELDNWTGPADELTKAIAKAVGSRDAAVSMETTPFASVDWRPVAHLPALPQVFPAESGQFETTESWRKAWWDAGVRCVYMTFGTYASTHGRPNPSWYDLKAPYSLYTADDVEGGFSNYKLWSPTSTGYVGCQSAPTPPDGGDMEKIGTQHGITGFMGWLRSQPVPARGPNYDPTKIDTWPWPDKLERTLNILVADHDEQANG